MFCMALGGILLEGLEGFNIVGLMDKELVYEKERESLLWDLRKLPFPLVQNDEEMDRKIREFDLEEYRNGLKALFRDAGMVENGIAAACVAEQIKKMP